jgi:anthranilate phosphoribosyltransferase
VPHALAPAPQASNAQCVYASAIRRLGRNARPEGDDGAGVLDHEAMTAVWSGLLARRFTPAQEAALLMGLRVHGESAAMLAACARASAAFVSPVATSGPTAVLHCLGNARRHPSLAPLLAMRVRELGLPVLLVLAAPTAAGSSASVLAALPIPRAPTSAAAAARLAADGLAAIALEDLSPALARLVRSRGELGFRNTAHTVLKLIAPVAGPGVLVSQYTHAPYRARLAAAIASLRLTALLLRGTEGDPVAWDGDAHAPLAWHAGVGQTLDHRVLPRADEAGLAGDDVATAAFCLRARGDPALVPASLEQQARQLVALSRLRELR